MTNETKEEAIPKGFWQDAQGNLVHEKNVRAIDKDRDAVVRKLCELAKQQRDTLGEFKSAAMDAVAQFVELSALEYNVAMGGKKGNVTLMSYDGRYKLVRSFADRIVFDERLNVAKHLIDECIQAWSKGSNHNIKTIVNAAFDVDKEGKVSTGKILGLRKLEITDEKWGEAMRAIGESIQVQSSKSYVRFYERDERGEYQIISLDIAGV